MKSYWSSSLRCMAGAWTGLKRQSRAVTVGLSLIVLVGGARLVLSLPTGEPLVFLGQQWLLEPAARALLAFVYTGTALILLLAAFQPRVSSVAPAILASTGLLSAAILLDPLHLSLLLLPVALLVAVLAVSSATISVARGASRFLAYATTPVLLVPVVFLLLERLALYPDELVLAEQAAWLVLPMTLVWLNLFPFAGVMRVWCRDELSLAAVFLWTVKDAVVIYLLLTLWHQNPLLPSQGVLSALRASGLATTVFSGVWALAASPSGILAAAAMSELGVAVQGLASCSSEATLSGLYLLVARSAAVLLAASGLLAMHQGAADEAPPNPRSAAWLRWVPGIIFAAGILSLAGALPLGGSFARQHIYAAWQAKEPHLRLAWQMSSAAIVLGLARTFWNARRTGWHTPHQRKDYVLLAFAACLILLCLWIGSRPLALLNLISGLFRELLPPFSSL